MAAMRVAIIADHNGVELKSRLSDWLAGRGHQVDDRAAHVSSDVVDYPPLCEDVCRQVVGGHADFAIVVGGSGSAAETQNRIESNAPSASGSRASMPNNAGTLKNTVGL